MIVIILNCYLVGKVFNNYIRLINEKFQKIKSKKFITSRTCLSYDVRIIEFCELL